MSKVYIGNLFSGENERDKYQDYCYQHKIYAIGWAIDVKANSIGEYEELAKKAFKDEKGKENQGLNRAIKVFKNIEKGDFIWTRCSKTGKYLLGRVAKNSKDINLKDFHLIYRDKNDKEVYCLSVPCESEWKIFNMDQVPGVVINGFYRITIKPCKQSEQIEKYCQNLYCELQPKDQDRQNLASLKAFLSSDDEEDLLGLYLQKEKHYLIYPSTNKRETAAYEYMLAKEKDDGSIQKAIIQCKMGNTDIELEDFEDYKNFEIYCVKDEGKVKYKGNTYKGDKKNVHVLSLMDLLIWAKDKDNIDILPDRIRENLKITDF